MNLVPIINVQPSQYKTFCCGAVELDEYLQRYAKGNHKKGIGKTFALVQDEKVSGYYTLSMGEIEHSSLPPQVIMGIPRYPIPIARIGRLAIDDRVKGLGLGKFLLVDALQRVWNAAQIVAAYAVVVDAKGPEAHAFYVHFGFVPFIHEPMSLILPLNTMTELFHV